MRIPLPRREDNPAPGRAGAVDIHFRPRSWDRAIFDSVVAGEYGALDFAGKTVVDIGAHIGSFSVLVALKGARRVLAFEAWADNFALLARNCAHLPVVECSNAAVWRSDTAGGALRWRAAADGENTGGGTVIDCAAVAGQAAALVRMQEVAPVAFDDIVERAGVVDLLKIDAEGSEYPILFTSRKLDRVREIVGEYHEISGLGQAMSIPGFPDWNIQRLAGHLADHGFSVGIRNNGCLGLFHAIRNPKGS